MRDNWKVKGGGSEEMRKGVEVIALSLSLTVIAIALIAVSSAGTQPVYPKPKYNIDGNLSDWGVDLTGNWSLNETWVPNDGIEFIVENNYDPNTPTYAWNYGLTQDSRFQGVHIRGTAPNYTVYDEPVVWCGGAVSAYVAEPYQGEKYDLEAKYLDQDDNYIYVAIVTSVPPNATGVDAPGDLGLDIDRNASTGEWGYEYGVKLGTNTGLTQWEIGYLPDWKPNYVIKDNSPGIFKDYLPPSGGKTGEAIGAYVQGPTCTEGPFMDRGKPTYIIEMAIPKSAVGVTGYLSQGMIHHTDACGNDTIDNPIPEFMTVVIPAAALICFVFFIHWRRWSGGK